jgi:hypothetical protein
MSAYEMRLVLGLLSSPTINKVRGSDTSLQRLAAEASFFIDKPPLSILASGSLFASRGPFGPKALRTNSGLNEDPGLP